MAQIPNIIPPAAFELIRNRIAEILIDEFNKQFLMTYDVDLDLDEKSIVVERSNQLDNTELSFINICLSGGGFDNKNYSGSVNGTYSYDIDIYTKSKTSALQSGDVTSSFRLQKLLRVCRYILEHPIYKTLGFSSPKINRVYCSQFNIAVPGPGVSDALSTMMSRLVFTVVSNESVELITPALISGYDTKIKINNTDEGYFYSGNS